VFKKNIDLRDDQIPENMTTRIRELCLQEYEITRKRDNENVRLCNNRNTRKRV